jgi:HK97 gp10 family phage protein
VLVAMNINVEVKGVKKSLAKVNRFEARKMSEIKRIIAKYAEKIKTQAQALAPVSPGGGNLRDSIAVEYYRGGLGAKVISGASYSLYLEYGTGIYSEHPSIPGRKTPWVYYSEDLGRYVFSRGIRAQPFFNPAVDAYLDDFVREMNSLT